MGLLKPIEAPSGATATYWRIVEVNINMLARTVRLNVAGYVDKPARDAGKAPLSFREVTLAMEESDTPATLTATVLYERLKVAVPFAGAAAFFDGAVDA